MGEKVVRKTFDSDDLVRQLLKMYVVLNKDDAGKCGRFREDGKI